MKETEVFHLSRRWNLEKWKWCICILICPQSGIVFGVAVKFPDVCSSSLFIGALWETGLKFKSACYHSIWRWVSFFSRLSFAPFPLPLILCKSAFLYLSSFFHHSTSVLYHCSLLLCYTSFFSLFRRSHHFSSPYPFLIVRTVNAYISLVVPCYTALKGSSSPDPIISTLCHWIPLFFSPPAPLFPLWYRLPSNNYCKKLVGLCSKWPLHVSIWCQSVSSNIIIQLLDRRYTHKWTDWLLHLQQHYFFEKNSTCEHLNAHKVFSL